MRGRPARCGERWTGMGCGEGPAKNEEERHPCRPFAPGTRTIGMCSFDGRSQARHECRSCEGQTSKLGQSYFKSGGRSMRAVKKGLVMALELLNLCKSFERGNR